MPIFEHDDGRFITIGRVFLFQKSLIFFKKPKTSGVENYGTVLASLMVYLHKTGENHEVYICYFGICHDGLY